MPSPGARGASAVPRACILIVDDVLANRALIRHSLPRDDFDLMEVSSGLEALEACRHNEFALILTDVRMPGMDGFQLAAALAQDDRTRETPIIFITGAEGDDLSRVKGYEFGAVDYIAKPVNEQVLVSKVRVFVDLWSSKRQLQNLLMQLEEKNRKLEAEVNERRRIETLVRHQAQHDALTSLPNRILLLDRLDTAFERAARHQESFALLYVDIDGFKPVNDTHGHHVGDELLRQISLRLLRAVRKTDTVSRLGGDEFALIVEEVSSHEAALQVGTKLCEALDACYRLELPDGPVEACITASIGIAVYPAHGLNRNDLINAADGAMYQAKRLGKNRAALAEPEPAAVTRIHDLLASRL